MIVIDDKIPFIKGVFEAYDKVHYLPGAAITKDDVRLADALIVRTRTACNKALLNDSKVRIVASATIGYDHIDSSWCESVGIEWTNAPGCNSGSVKQYMASVLVSLANKRKLDLSKMTLGIIGLGNVGTKLVDVAKAFGMTLLLNDPPRERNEGFKGFCSLDYLIEHSDIISLHVPLICEGQDITYHLFDKDRIANLRKDQILINTSRGPVVDNLALKNALIKGSLAGAVLDVWEGEPNIDLELAKLLDFATPHIAGYSADGKALGTQMAVRAVARKLGIEELMDWMPSTIPSAEKKDINLMCGDRNHQDLLSEAILHTYNVDYDSQRLLSSPHLFESLRGDYQIRREPSAFRLQFIDAQYSSSSLAPLKESLRLLGFELD